MAYYGAEPGDARRSFLTFAWIVLADAILKFFARCASCVDPLHLDASEFSRIYSNEAGSCGPDGLFGTPVALHFTPRDGAIFGLVPGVFTGSFGQLYALGLLALVGVVSVLLLRWQWRAQGDPRIVGALLAGAFISSLPRLVGDGRGITQLDLFGVGVHLGDFALALALFWAASRAVGEWRA